MPTRSPSTSSPLAAAAGRRDAALAGFARSLIDAARREWPERFVREPDATCNPARVYTETHYALAAVLLFLVDRADRRLLDVAAERLRLWDKAGGPMTFFNSMAVCLAAIALRQADERHQPLDAAIEQLLARTREHRHVAYPQWCGNNAYLQQVAVDMVLLPLARRQQVPGANVEYLLRELRRYRTPEGFFYDLPREGDEQERLCPPTYIMKTLFLAGMCHELQPDAQLEAIFMAGMRAALPLLTRHGDFSYFGRTDNSPFAAGLTIFNLRKAARLSPPQARNEFERACSAAERNYLTFPRNADGMLQCNRFGVASSSAETVRSRDTYAYPGQYTLSSCAYALLGCYWFPEASDHLPADAVSPAPPAHASSDLGVVVLRTGDSELVLRTASQLTAWDRRYLGPTILRYENGEHLAVGAIAKAVATDADLRPAGRGRAARVRDWVHDRLVKGIEQLDATSVGFLPVLRRGSCDYLPAAAIAQQVSAGRVRTEYAFLRLSARGLRPLLIDARERLQQSLPLLPPRRFSRPPIRSDSSLRLVRDVYLTGSGCRIEDRLTGSLRGKMLLFSVRYLPEARLHVSGLVKEGSTTGWGSNGRHTIDRYVATTSGSEIRYTCDIERADASRR